MYTSDDLDFRLIDPEYISEYDMDAKRMNQVYNKMERASGRGVEMYGDGYLASMGGEGGYLSSMGGEGATFRGHHATLMGLESPSQQIIDLLENPKIKSILTKDTQKEGSLSEQELLENKHNRLKQILKGSLVAVAVCLFSYYLYKNGFASWADIKEQSKNNYTTFSTKAIEWYGKFKGIAKAGVPLAMSAFQGAKKLLNRKKPQEKPHRKKPQEKPPGTEEVHGVPESGVSIPPAQIVDPSTSTTPILGPGFGGYLTSGINSGGARFVGHSAYQIGLSNLLEEQRLKNLITSNESPDRNANRFMEFISNHKSALSALGTASVALVVLLYANHLYRSGMTYEQLKNSIMQAPDKFKADAHKWATTIKGFMSGIYNKIRKTTPATPATATSALGFGDIYDDLEDNPVEGGMIPIPAILGAISAAPSLINMGISGIKWIVNKIKNRKKKPEIGRVAYGRTDEGEETASGMHKHKKLDPDTYQYLEKLKEYSPEFKKIEKANLRHKNINPMTYYKNLMQGTGYLLTKVGFPQEYAQQYIDHISKKKFGGSMAKRIMESDDSKLPKIKNLKYSDLVAPIILGRGIHTLSKNGMKESDAKTLSIAVNEIIMSHGKKEFNKNVDNITKGGSVFKTLQNKINKVTGKYGEAIEKRIPAGVPYSIMHKSIVGKKRASSKFMDTLGNATSFVSRLAPLVPLGMAAYDYYSRPSYTAPPAYNPEYTSQSPLASAPPIGTGKYKKGLADRARERSLYEV